MAISQLVHYTSETGGFNNALLEANGDGIVVVNENETINTGALYTIEAGVTSRAESGVLTLQSGSTVRIYGNIVGSGQLFDHEDDGNRGDIDWRGPGPIRPEWFGVKATASDNLQELAAAWKAAKSVSSGRLGSRLDIGSGQYTINGYFDMNDTGLGFGSGQCKDRIMNGQGQRNTILYLASNANTSLFNWDNTQNSFLMYMGFDGNKANNNDTGMENDALVRLSSYNTAYVGLNCRNSAKDNMLWAGSQMISNFHLDSEYATRYGMVISDVYGWYGHGIGSEQNDVGGLLIEYTNNDRLKRPSIDIDGLYLESNPVGVQINGVWNVTIDSVCHTGGKIYALGSNLVDSSTYYSEWNILDLRESTTEVEILSGCKDNVFVHNPISTEGAFDDQDGRNTVTIPHGRSWQHKGWQGSPPVSATGLLSSSHPCEFGFHYLGTGASTEIVEGSLLSPGAAYSNDNTFDAGWTGGPCHLRIVAGPNQNGTQILPGFFSYVPNTTLYLYLLAGMEGRVTAYISVLDTANSNKFYNFSDHSWQTTSNASTVYKIAITNAEAQLFRIPIQTDADGDASPRTPRMQVGLVHGWGNALNIYYAQVSESKCDALIHTRGGNQVGFGSTIQYTFASLPPASDLHPGTQIWDSTNNRLVFSDGTNWRDASGSIAS